MFYFIGVVNGVFMTSVLAVFTDEKEARVYAEKISPIYTDVNKDTYITVQESDLDSINDYKNWFNSL